MKERKKRFRRIFISEIRYVKIIIAIFKFKIYITVKKIFSMKYKKY